MLRTVLFLAALTLVACSKKDESAPLPATSAPSTVTTTPAAPDGAKLAVGDPAPDVDLPLQDGRHVKLADFKGKLLVVYFYPKDETSGCTVEANNFKDKYADLKKADVTVIGVSTQDAASHKAFIEKEGLPFDLAIDNDGAIAKAFGVPINMTLHKRQTFLIGRDGKVKKVWRDVTPKDHAVEVLAAAQS